jgi:hypothetical protein
MALTIETHGDWVIINGTAVRKNHISMVKISQHDRLTSFLEITLSGGKTMSWDAGSPDEARRVQSRIMDLAMLDPLFIMDLA